MAFYKIIGDELGLGTGPFIIKTNTGVTLATGVTRLQILAGYTVNVPAGATDLVVTSDPANTTCVTNATFPVPNEGFWEMEKSNVETISDHYGAIQANYTTPTDTFVADDVVGIYTGVVSGTGTWLIKGGPEDIAGTTYNGGGTLILTGNNTPSITTTIESGAIVQLGRDLNALTGAIASGTITVQAGAELNIVGANEAPGRAVLGDLINSGNVTITGPDVCGEGNFRNQGYWDNRSLVTIEDAKFSFNNPTPFTASAGTMQVLDGGTLDVKVPMPAAQTLQLNGTGKCSAFGLPQGALEYGAAVTIAGPIEIQSDTLMTANGAGPTVFSGVLSGSSTLTLDNYAGTATSSGSATFSNAGNTFTGDLVIDSTTLQDSHPLAFDQSDVTMVGSGAIQTTNAITFKSLASASPNTTIITWSVPITLTDNGVTTFAGRIWSSQAGFNTVTIDGTGTEMTLTNPAVVNSGYRALDGAKFSFTGGQGIGKLDVENGSKFTFGRTTSGYVYPGALTMTGGSTIEVQAISPSAAGSFTAYAAFNVTGGYNVDLVDAMVPGTYNIMRATAGGTGVGQLPTIGVNNTGLTPTFSWSGQFLRVTLA